MIQSKIVNFSALVALGLTLAGCPANPGWTGGAVFDHVLVIVLENTNYKDAVKDPYLAKLATEGALFTNFHGNFHPSYGNYLAMVGGKYFGTFLDNQKNIDARTIADLLEENGLTWKNYAEGYPGSCFLGDKFGNFARKHVPFLSFKNIQSNPERCARVVDGMQFQGDVAAGTMPNYMFYSPDLQDDGHDSDLPTASAWLEDFLEPLLADQKFMDRTLIEITFDESKTYLNNHIYTLFLGNMVQAGVTVDRKLNHYDVLRTIEDNFGLGTLGAEDDETGPITEVWKDPADAEVLQLVRR